MNASAGTRPRDRDRRALRTCPDVRMHVCAKLNLYLN